MNAFELSRSWFNFSFESEEVKPIHGCLYFWCIEMNNKLGWKDSFGLPTDTSMEAVGCKNYKTYAAALEKLVEWGFIELLEKSKNQFTSNVIALVKNTKAISKADTKALTKALPNQDPKHCSITDQSIASIDKPLNLQTFKPLNLQTTPEGEAVEKNEFLDFVKSEELNEVWYEFVRMRKKSKVKFTEFAEALNAKKVFEISEGKKLAAKKIIETTIEQGWQSFYPLKEEKNGVTKQKIPVAANRLDGLGD